MNDIRHSFARYGLIRSRDERVLGGVCAGLGRRLGLGPWTTRLLFVLVLLVLPGSQLLIYPILWILMPSQENVADVTPTAPTADTHPLSRLTRCAETPRTRGFSTLLASVTPRNPMKPRVRGVSDTAHTRHRGPSLRGMERTTFTVDSGTGALSGWTAGEGPRVLAVHGGPGMGYGYLDDAVAELAPAYAVATFQQRGLPPSTETGEFTVDEAVADLVAVLDGLGWDSAYLMGHSWGGHLVFHAAVAIPERLDGVLSVDPLGAVGDGGMEAFGAEMVARLPEEVQARAKALDDKDMAGEATPEESHEAFSLFWPSYFADPSSAPPMPDLAFSQVANVGLFGDLFARLPELEAALPSIDLPFGVVVGERSPMPTTAGTDSAARIPGAWAHVVPGAGHFPWHESPGSLRAAMDRLVR
ncbi:MAG: alpha/beta fold hydrolase [Nocardioides sp.]